MPKVHHFVLLVTLIYVQCSLLFVCLISAVNAAWFNKLQTEHDVFPIYSNPKIRHKTETESAGHFKDKQTVASKVFCLQFLVTQPSHSSVMADVFTIGQGREEHTLGSQVTFCSDTTHYHLSSPSGLQFPI
jgi:hypothetical protein